MACSCLLRLTFLAAVSYVCSGQCTNKIFNMPPQTLGGSGSMEIQTAGGKLGNLTIPATNQTTLIKMFESVDYNTMNMVLRMNQNMSQGGSHPFYLQQDIGAIMNWKAGLMTYYQKMTSPFNVDHTDKEVVKCKTIQLPFILRFLPIGEIVKKMQKLTEHLYKCVGHHDDLDEFGIDVQFPPHWVPKFVAERVNAPHVNLTLGMEVDAAGLLKSYHMNEGMEMKVKMNLDGKVETMDSHTQLQQSMVFSESQAGGPSEEDLKVPAEWGNCGTIHTPELGDLLAEWERSDSPFLGHSRIIPHTLRAIMAEAEATASAVVV